MQRVRRFIVTAVVAISAMCAMATAASACSTWQYVPASGATVRSSPGGSIVHTVLYPQGSDISGALVNITQRPGSWYYGTLYYTGTFGVSAPAATGWILASHLSYVRCW